MRLLGKTLVGASALSTGLFGVVVSMLFLSIADEDSFAAVPTSACSVLPQLSGDPKNLTQAQRRNAQIVIEVGKKLKVPPRGWTIALMAALQESSLHNIPYGDRDSAGLFQQRRPWGPLADRMDPVKSATMFYTGGREGQRGLLDVPGWEAMPLGGRADRAGVRVPARVRPTRARPPRSSPPGRGRRRGVHRATARPGRGGSRWPRAPTC